MTEVPFIKKFGKFLCLILNSVNSQISICNSIGIPLPINYITLKECEFLSCILYCRNTQQIFAPYAKQQHWDVERYGSNGEVKD